MADNSGAGQFGESSAFASAVARARQIAAKITPGAGDAQVPGIKRAMDDGASFGEPDSKKLAGDPLGGQLGGIGNQPGFGGPSPQSTEAARAAQEAAARINRQLGINPADPMQATKPPGPMGAPGMMGVTEEHRVPDKMVGLIIGKGGEQITRLQAETGCKVQIAPDSGGSDMRPCQLTGSPQAIMECKRQMSQIIERGQGAGAPGPMDHGMGEGSTVVEMNIPGQKVGLIIGKGGETIRQLQESANVKMVMIQDSNSPTAHDKPLRISGDPQRCQRAKEMVLELLAEKDGMPRPGGNMFNDYGSQAVAAPFQNNHMGGGGPPNGMDIGVPRQGVGLVIGKKGEMIQKIQNETGAKVQFKTDDGQSQDRICSVTGPPDKVQQAVQKIQELLSKANIMGGHPIHKGPGGGFGGPMGPGGPMNDMNRGPGGPFSPPGGRNMGGRFDGGGMQDSTTYAVPADKCGLVIGKGGENIREMIRQTGAHIELDRNPPANPSEKIFNIRGNPQQIQAAISMIQEKTGQQGGPNDQGHGPVGGPGGMMGGPGGPNGPPGGPGPQGPGGPGPQFGGQDQFGGQFSQPNQPPQQFSGAPQGWNAYGNQFPQQQNMANKPSNDANAAAWAYYYAAYGGQGQPGQQPGAPAQPAAAPAQPPAQQQQQPAPQISYAQPSELRVNHTINPSTGQPDYSQAWVEYYRSQGMIHEASMVLQQVAQNQAATAAATQQPGQP